MASSAGLQRDAFTLADGRCLPNATADGVPDQAPAAPHGPPCRKRFQTDGLPVLAIGPGEGSDRYRNSVHRVSKAPTRVSRLRRSAGDRFRWITPSWRLD